MPIERRPHFATVLSLYTGFVLTGLGTTLLGCILPRLSAMWRINDGQAGILFAAQFSGAALGALLVGRNFAAAVLRGYLLLIAAAFSIALFPHLWESVRFLCFGLGLGLTMTATSMLISGFYAEKRGQVLSFLNGSWTIGAAMSPQIAFYWTRNWPPIYIFGCLAAAVSIVCAVFLYSGKVAAGTADPLDEFRARSNEIQLILMFAALGCLYVGVEASVSGWLMSYVHRLPLTDNAWSPVATSSFWIALLCGRMLAPVVLSRISEARLLTVTIAIAFIGNILMLVSRSPLAITATVAITGLVLGPIYPLCLAKTLAYTNNSPRAKWVFAISGIGGALFPSITGIVSVRTDSLRVGLFVPVVGLVGMMLLNWRLSSTPTLASDESQVFI